MVYSRVIFFNPLKIWVFLVYLDNLHLIDVNYCLSHFIFCWLFLLFFLPSCELLTYFLEFHFICSVKCISFYRFSVSALNITSYYIICIIFIHFIYSLLVS